MSLLAIDSSADICSVAFFKPSVDSFSSEHFANNVIESIETTPRQHSQKLLPLLDHIMLESSGELSELTAFVVGAGPGSFTGLRIAAGLVQGLAFSLDKPIIPVCSLRAYAQHACDYHSLPNGAEIVVATDARMEEVYWQVFKVEQGIVQSFESNAEPQVGKLAEMHFQSQEQTFLVGDGWQVYQVDSLGTHLALPRFPSASSFLKLAYYDLSVGVDNAVAAQNYAPAYIRNTVSWKKIHEQ